MRCFCAVRNEELCASYRSVLWEFVRASACVSVCACTWPTTHYQCKMNRVLNFHVHQCRYRRMQAYQTNYAKYSRVHPRSELFDCICNTATLKLNLCLVASEDFFLKLLSTSVNFSGTIPYCCFTIAHTVGSLRWPYDRNTCAEVTAFTPTCDTSPTSEPHEAHQYTHTSGRSEHICSSRLFHLHRSRTMCAWVCVGACACVCVMSSQLPLYSRCSGLCEFSFSVPFNLIACRIFGTVALVHTHTHTHTPESVLFTCRGCFNVMCCMFAYARQSPSHFMSVLISPFLSCSPPMLKHYRTHITNAQQSFGVVLFNVHVSHSWRWWAPFFRWPKKAKNKMSYFNFSTQNSNVSARIIRNWI